MCVYVATCALGRSRYSLLRIFINSKLDRNMQAVGTVLVASKFRNRL